MEGHPDRCTDLMIAPAAGGAITGAGPSEHDLKLVELWLNGRGRNTQRAYRRDIERFFAFARKPLQLVTLEDLQGFGDQLAALPLSPSSRHRTLSAVKSLFAFGTRLRYFPFDVALPLRLPEFREQLAGRILEEDEVLRMIAGETCPRNHLILHLLYAAGVRVSELVALTWRDAQAHRGGGQITVFGKGSKTRVIRLEATVWKALNATRGSAAADAPIFVSRRGGKLDTSQVFRIVKTAAVRAGVTKAVSPHWLRHCHASHALDRGAPIHLVQQTLGHSSVATTSRYLHARPNESSSRFLPEI